MSEEIEEKKSQSSPVLTAEQQQSLDAVLGKFSSCFSTHPGNTTLVSHRIHTTCNKPIVCSPYRLPLNLASKVKAELDSLLDPLLAAI